MHASPTYAVLLTRIHNKWRAVKAESYGNEFVWFFMYCELVLYSNMFMYYNKPLISNRLVMISDTAICHIFLKS
jgi:hypothetical protein